MAQQNPKDLLKKLTHSFFTPNSMGSASKSDEMQGRKLDVFKSAVYTF